MFPIQKRCDVLKTVLFLVGPTGSGKTELALRVARRLGCEIISCDSMQVYQGMDIGTAKPTIRERKEIPHYLIDIIPPTKCFSIYAYRTRALKAIRRIARGRKIPLVVGGSGLYFEALRKGLSPQPAGQGKLRREIMKMGDQLGVRRLYEVLQNQDPEIAKGIHPNNVRRIVRALEIIRISGRKASEGKAKRQSLEDLGFKVRIYGIHRDRADLYERINRRMRQMFQKGLFREVRQLSEAGLSRTAEQALGYREVLQHLRKGEPRPSAELVEEIQKRTRQFAKRQLTWFRREKEIQWIPWGWDEKPLTVSRRILSDFTEWVKNEPC